MEPEVGENFHSHAEAHTILAQCFLRTGNYSLALEHADFGLALAEEYGFSDSRVDDFSRTQLGVSNVAEGLSYPEDYFTGPMALYVELGNDYFERGLYEQAIVSYESAVGRHWIDSGQLFRALGESYSNLGRHQEALGYYSRAIAARDDGNNRTWRAFEYFYSLNDCDMAVVDAEVALGHPIFVRDGTNSRSDALWLRGQCLLLSGNVDGALADVQEAIRLARESGSSLGYIAPMENFYQDLLDWKASQGSPAP